MDKIFVDADIVMDFLARRIPFHHAADELFKLSDKGEITLAISSLTFSHLHYILSKQKGKNEARKALKRFKVLVTVAKVDDKVIDIALASSFRDFEDAIQYYAAIEHACTIILTRNIKDYKEAKIPVMTAESYVKLLR